MSRARSAASDPSGGSSGRPFHLLAVLLLTFVLVPVVHAVSGASEKFWLEKSMSVAMLAVLVVAAATVAHSARPWLVGIVLVGPPALLEVVQQFVGDASPIVRSLGALYVGLALLYAVAHGLRRLFAEKTITGHTIAIALCAYILIGLAWSWLYEAVELASPTAPAFGDVERDGGDLFYFSFVTLSTLGYGDMTPSAPVARSLAIVEAIVGQFYVAVVLARLVAMQLTARREQRAGDADDQG